MVLPMVFDAETRTGSLTQAPAGPIGAGWGKSDATSSTAPPASRAIIRIDADISMRQIAGPDGGAPLANADIDRDFELRPLHVSRARLFRVAGSDPALFGDQNITKADGQQVAIRLLAGFADGHDDAAPIGVLAGKRGLDQRRIRDGKPDAPGGAIILGAGDGDGGEFAGALAILDDLDREIAEYPMQRFAEGRITW